MATLYDLLSQAAAKIGADPVPNLTDDTRDVEVWSALWQPILQRSLDESPWPFATVTAPLSQLLTAPTDPRYAYAYSLPGDYSVTRALLNQNGYPEVGPYEVQGALIYSNRSTLFLKYGRLFTINDIPLLPTWFCSYYVCALAYEAANALTGLQSDLERCARDLTLTQRQAHVAAGMQNSPQYFGSPSRLRTARYQR